jgi:DNA mismatch repair protein MutS2
MIYPKNFEQKIGFDEIRNMLMERCMTTLGKSRVAQMTVSTDGELINQWMRQIHELRNIRQGQEQLPLGPFSDIREGMKRLRLTGTYLEEEELFDLMRTLQTIADLVKFLKQGEEDKDGKWSMSIPSWPCLRMVSFPCLPLFSASCRYWINLDIYVITLHLNWRI